MILALFMMLYELAHRYWEARLQAPNYHLFSVWPLTRYLNL